MLNSTNTSSVRILPNNKVYRQLFEAQVQLSDAYKQVRNNQLTQSLNITTGPESIPLVRNIRPHEKQKRQWLTSKSFNNDSSINPVITLFHEERKRRENEQKQELNELKREVFNLPDDIEYIANENTENKKGNITERLATNRHTKFTELWNELLSKIAETNQNLLVKLEKITRECNTYYEQGDKDINDQLQNLIYQKEITSLTIRSFEKAFQQLDQLLPARLSQIQEYCQSIQELESERINQIRDLFKSYSQRLYRTHHLSDEDTAYRLEKQANELNTEILDNRRTYAELEARLLAGETIRAHRCQGELHDYENKWRDAIWIIHKQTWISKLSQYKAKLEPTILSTCESIGSDIATQTQAFISHIDSLNTFIPPKSTRDNVQKWYNQGCDIVNIIVNKRKELIQQINELNKNEIDTLKKESENIREKILQNRVYTKEQVQIALERDIYPLFEERKRFLQESIIDRIQAFYERSTNGMCDILDRLLAFIQPAAEQWDDHQNRLEHVTVQLHDMMRECRRPHDVQNEKKLAKLDSTLDEMRSASNEKALTRLLQSSYEQLDTLKSNYTQFYDQEHQIVNKYSDMISEEVNRYKTEMLDYFHARPISGNKSSTTSSSSSSHQYHITSLSRTTYELGGYSSNELNFTQQIDTNERDEKSATSPTMQSSSDNHSRLKSISYDQSQIQTFLTDEPILTNEINFIPFDQAFYIPPNLITNLMLNLCRAFLDHFDQWKEETIQRIQTIVFSKHEELDKEMDVQIHLHEPRRLRIETDIHNVRTAEIVMHEERVERHIRGVQETLEQTDADYTRMLNDFSKSLNTYQDDVFSLEEVFLNATTSGRLLALEDRLKKQRNTYMEHIRTSLRKFRKHFEGIMQYLTQANMKFRKSLKPFSEGGNFSREEIEVHRKKLEKTAFQIDQAERMIFKEMDKLEKKQLEEANKIMNQFRERFKNHMTDLQFIELTNRWISEAQVKIKSEVAIDNQQSHILKTLVILYENKIDSILNPNLDKQTSTSNEVRDLFHQIVLFTYERALYLKCLNNELAIPSSLIPILKEKGLITEEELMNDLHIINPDEVHSSRRPSKVSAGFGSNMDEMKSVKFASSSSPTTTSSRHKRGSTALLALNGGQPLEDLTTISTIQSLLHKNEKADSNEIVEPGAPTALTGPNTRSMISDSSSQSSKKSKQHDGKNSESSAANQRERPTRARTRDDIYKYYCTFGEKKHTGRDFMSKILNILRDSTEGLLSHSEVFYKEKGFRPVTRPQALREKFDDFAQMMIEKLKNYEQQCRTYHEQSINEFRDILQSFERISSLMSKIEFNQLIIESEKILFDYQKNFHILLNKNLNQTKNDREKNFELLRPTFGHPGKKDHLENIDNQEKLRQIRVGRSIDQLRLDTIDDIQTNAQRTVEIFARNAENLLILFDDILTADEITRTKLPIVKQSLTELIRRQQAGKPLEDSEPTPLIERKQGHWSGLPLLDDEIDQRPESVTSTKQSSPTSQRQKSSASIVTQKTTLPQIETIKQRDNAYQRYKDNYTQILNDVDTKCSAIMIDLDRYRVYWNASIDKLHQLRTN